MFRYIGFVLFSVKNGNMNWLLCTFHSLCIAIASLLFAPIAYSAWHRWVSVQYGSLQGYVCLYQCKTCRVQQRSRGKWTGSTEASDSTDHTSYTTNVIFPTDLFSACFILSYFQRDPFPMHRLLAGLGKLSNLVTSTFKLIHKVLLSLQLRLPVLHLCSSIAWFLQMRWACSELALVMRWWSNIMWPSPDWFIHCS